MILLTNPSGCCSGNAPFEIYPVHFDFQTVTRRNVAPDRCAALAHCSGVLRSPISSAHQFCSAPFSVLCIRAAQNLYNICPSAASGHRPAPASSRASIVDPLDQLRFASRHWYPEFFAHLFQLHHCHALQFSLRAALSYAPTSRHPPPVSRYPMPCPGHLLQQDPLARHPAPPALPP